MIELNEERMKAISKLASYILDTEVRDFNENPSKDHIYHVAKEVSELISPTIWVCPECGSEDVQESAWLEVNTGKVISAGLDGPRDRFWCEGCESELKGLVEKK